MTGSTQIISSALVLPSLARAGTHGRNVSLLVRNRLLQDKVETQCSNTINKLIFAKETVGCSQERLSNCQDLFAGRLACLLALLWLGGRLPGVILLPFRHR
jgi:hypothetical protein